MKLEEFVAETIRQVVAGVKAAQEGVRENEGILNPCTAMTSAPRQDIAFDVAVTTSEGTEAKGSAGIFVGAFGLGSSLRGESSTASVSRIRFAVPVALPSLLVESEYRGMQERRATEGQKSAVESVGKSEDHD